MENRLKIIILENRITIKELAEKLNFSPQTISNWCNGKNLGNVHNFYKLCKELDVDIKDIFIDEE